MDDRFRGKTALVTGASSGIGREIARWFAGAGATVILVARRADRLHALAEQLAAVGSGSAAHPLVADLTAPDACEHIASSAARLTGRVDVLVNNAGVGSYGTFTEQDLAEIETMVLLNNTVLTRLTHRLLPEMIARRSGWVLNVASMAAFQPMPFMSAYAATKAHVLQFSLSLREEVLPKGVTVTCLCPGLTRTEFFDNSDYGALRRQIDKRSADPARVAEAACRALAAGRPICVPGLGNKASVFVERFLPVSLLGRIMRGMLTPRDG